MTDVRMCGRTNYLFDIILCNVRSCNYILHMYVYIYTYISLHYITYIHTCVCVCVKHRCVCVCMAGKLHERFCKYIHTHFVLHTHCTYTQYFAFRCVYIHTHIHLGDLHRQVRIQYILHI